MIRLASGGIISAGWINFFTVNSVVSTGFFSWSSSDLKMLIRIAWVFAPSFDLFWWDIFLAIAGFRICCSPWLLYGLTPLCSRKVNISFLCLLRRLISLHTSLSSYAEAVNFSSRKYNLCFQAWAFHRGKPSCIRPLRSMPFCTMCRS